MTANALKQGNFGSLVAIYLFIFLPSMNKAWGFKKNPQALFCTNVILIVVSASIEQRAHLRRTWDCAICDCDVWCALSAHSFQTTVQWVACWKETLILMASAHRWCAIRLPMSLSSLHVRCMHRESEHTCSTQLRLVLCGALWTDSSSGKFILNLRTATGWRRFFQIFSAPVVRMIFLEKSANSFGPVFFFPNRNFRGTWYWCTIDWPGEPAHECLTRRLTSLSSQGWSPRREISRKSAAKNPKIAFFWGWDWGILS